MRYINVQEELEARLGRPFLTAAPNEGAARAAATASLMGEAAWGRKEVAATTTADIAKYYEQITYEELAHGAVSFGIPQSIICLALHQYTGPRRVRVGKAHSAAVFPKRSVIAGCSWATVFIRAITIGPAEKFLRAIKQRCDGFDVSTALNIYIDDLALSTAGLLREAALLHRWATRLLVRWVTVGLKKSLAPDKLICIVSNSPLRRALLKPLREVGCAVCLEGDLLGADFSAGGVIRRRRGLRKRCHKNKKRWRRLRWWHRIGGNAREAARGGTGPSISFGASSAGLPPFASHLRRRLQAAASYVTASGSSLTTRLALGGNLFADIDPSVCDPNPPWPCSSASSGIARTSAQDSSMPGSALPSSPRLSPISGPGGTSGALFRRHGPTFGR